MRSENPLKVAVSAGLAVAEDSGVIPPSTFEVIATTTHRTVESLAAFGDVIRGRKTMTEAIIEVKNTAVSTFSALCGKGTAPESFTRSKRL